MIIAIIIGIFIWRKWKLKHGATPFWFTLPFSEEFGSFLIFDNVYFRTLSSGNIIKHVFRFSLPYKIGNQGCDSVVTTVVLEGVNNHLKYIHLKSTILAWVNIYRHSFIIAIYIIMFIYTWKVSITVWFPWKQLSIYTRCLKLLKNCTAVSQFELQILRTSFHMHSFTFNPLQNSWPYSLFTYHLLIPKKGYSVQHMVVTNFMNFFHALQLVVIRNCFRFMNHFWAGNGKIKNHH